MNRSASATILIVVMVVVIVAVDVLFLRDRFWLRLLVNVCIVATAGIVYAIFLRR